MSLAVVHYGFWRLVIDWLIRIAPLFWIPSCCSPASARTWLRPVGLVPLAGLPLYFALGHPWLSQRRRARQGRASRLIRAEQVPLAALRWPPPGASDDRVGDIARLAERLGDFMSMSGNAVDLLADYDASLRALLADIDAARREVHLLYYLMFDDAVGHAFADALRRAAARGVRCRVLLDAVGGKRGLRAFCRAAAIRRCRDPCQPRARRTGLAAQRAHGPAQPPQDRGDRRHDRLHRFAEPGRARVHRGAP